MVFLPRHQIVTHVFLLPGTSKEKMSFYFRCLSLSHFNSHLGPPRAPIHPLSQPLYSAQVTFLGLTDVYDPRAYLFSSASYCYVPRWPFDTLPLQWISDILICIENSQNTDDHSAFSLMMEIRYFLNMVRVSHGIFSKIRFFFSDININYKSFN